METFDIYQDIMTRTGGDIYIGVVGPVRTGKSTFITKFMENLVLPNIKDENRRARVIDELPQSAEGKTIMTTEPKFVPDDGVKVQFGDNLSANIRLIDSVGYIVSKAEGYHEGDRDRYVNTPWSEEKMTFKDAGELGTKKVILDHSTVGIVVTTDGSITDIDRASYLESEERIISDMKALGKPFVVVLNSKEPNSKSAKELKKELETKYKVNVFLTSVANMTKNDADNLLREVLLEFPIKTIEIDIPSYMAGLSIDNYIIDDITSKVLDKTRSMSRMADVRAFIDVNSKTEYIDKVTEGDIDFGKGVITYELKAKDSLFYEVISSESGVKISSDLELVSYIKRLKDAEEMYTKMAEAIGEADAMGYGIVMPSVSEIEVGEPTLYKKGGKCQVKLSAKAPSVHIMKVDIETEICPIMGSEEQCNEMIDYINKEAEGGDLMDVTLFNKPLGKMITDELASRSSSVSSDTRSKLVKTMSRIMNEGKGGVLCILI